MADPIAAADVSWSVEGAEIGRYANAKHADDDDFSQPGTMYREVMSDMDRDHLVDNIVGHASDEVATETQERVVAYWGAVDADLGARVAAGSASTARGPLHPLARHRRRARQPRLTRRGGQSGAFGRSIGSTLS